MKVVFELELEGLLPKINLKLPSLEVLNGSSFIFDGKGNCKQFYDNGAIALHGTVLKNKRNGIWVFFFPNGSTYAEGNYKDGMKDGEWICYNNVGKVTSHGLYLDDLKNGEWSYFS
jgi:antitoxin component YwqK of YwqJK toxin-antitoxin module